MLCLLQDPPSGLVSYIKWGASQGSPCQEALGEGEDLKLHQMASAVFSFNI